MYVTWFKNVIGVLFRWNIAYRWNVIIMNKTRRKNPPKRNEE